MPSERKGQDKPSAKGCATTDVLNDWKGWYR
jgi:hypothetical protein